MTALAQLLDGHPQPWTAEEWLGLGELPAWPRIELIDGSLYVSPYAVLAHQRACARLARLLDGAIAGHPLEVFSPANVQLSAESAVIPDVVVCRAGLTGLAAAAADVVLVAEVESPSTRAIDRLVKPAAYARAGINRYWRVELDGPDGPVVCRYGRDGDVYVLSERVPAGSRLVAAFDPRLPGIRVQFDPAALTQ